MKSHGIKWSVYVNCLLELYEVEISDLFLQHNPEVFSPLFCCLSCSAFPSLYFSQFFDIYLWKRKVYSVCISPPWMLI